MLCLLKNVTDGTTYYLIGKSEFIFGRKDCDICIQNDKSISRKHAIIRIKDGRVTVEDCKTTYFTHHNGNKLDPNNEVLMRHNDEVQFGVLHSKYRFEQHNYVTTTSRLTSSEKAKLKKELSLLGVEYSENWTSSCTHLTVDKITVTVKLLHALIDEKHIVRPAYWTKFVKNLGKKLPPPSVTDYNDPPVAEALLNQVDLQTNPLRKSLFKKKMFVFLKEDRKKEMEDVIRKAGGSSISWEKDPLSLDDVTKSPKEFLIIQSPGDEEDSSLNEVIKSFSRQGKRTIPLQEIAMAILYCSCEKDCNPNFNRVGQVFIVPPQNLPTQNNALAADSESQYFPVTQCKRETDGKMIIPDTLEANLCDVSMPCTSVISSVSTSKAESDKQSTKRTNDHELKDNPFKKIKTDQEIILSEKKAKSSQQQDKKDNYLSKTITPKRKVGNLENTESNETKKTDNPFLLVNQNKMKSEAASALRNENPFKIIRKQNDPPTLSQASKPNPFTLCISKKKREDDNIPDLPSGKRTKHEEKRDKIFHSTLLDNIPDKSMYFSKLSKITSSEMNSTWFSKNVKTGVDESLEGEVDPEMQEFLDRFKDTIVVEVMAKLRITTRSIVDELDGTSMVNGKHNYKRFKKVKPLRPQTTIIGKTNFVAHEPADTTGIVESRKMFHMDNDENVVKNKNKAPRKFLI